MLINLTVGVGFSIGDSAFLGFAKGNQTPTDLFDRFVEAQSTGAAQPHAIFH
jgi:hypothetical protein